MLSFTQYLPYLRVLIANPKSLPILLTGGVSEWLERVTNCYGDRGVPRVVTAHGFRIFLFQSWPVEGLALIGLFRDFEPETSALFGKIVKPGMTVVDVGANIGWYSLLSARLVGEKGRVIAFEPEPRNYKLMQTSITENDLKNIEAIRACVADYDGVARLSVAEKQPGLHSIVRRISARSIEVKACTLDAALQVSGISHIDLLKIDTEGAEPLVIKGASKFILGGRCDNIIMEWNPDAWIGRESLLLEVLKKYELFRNNHTPFLLNRISMERLWDSSSWSKGGRTLFFHKKEARL